MSTSLLYHGFRVRGYRFVKTQYLEGEIVLHVGQPPERFRCSACGSADVVSRGQVERRFRGVPIGRKPVWIALPIPRVACRACGVVRQVAVAFAESRVSYTKAFARYALELSRLMTIKDVARHLGISWDVIKEIQKQDLRQRFGNGLSRKNAPYTIAPSSRKLESAKPGSFDAPRRDGWSSLLDSPVRFLPIRIPSRH